jgi:hypothetical protein
MNNYSCCVAEARYLQLLVKRKDYLRVIPVEGSSGVAAFAFLVLVCAQRQTESREAAGQLWRCAGP